MMEGIGLDRLTRNFAAGLDAGAIDGAFRGTDLEAVRMARFLLHNEGLFLGSSSAMNCVGVVKAARGMAKEWKGGSLFWLFVRRYHSSDSLCPTTSSRGQVQTPRHRHDALRQRSERDQQTIQRRLSCQSRFVALGRRSLSVNRAQFCGFC